MADRFTAWDERDLARESLISRDDIRDARADVERGADTALLAALLNAPDDTEDDDEL